MLGTCPGLALGKSVGKTTQNPTVSKTCPDPPTMCLGVRKSEFIEKIANVTSRFHFE